MRPGRRAASRTPLTRLAPSDVLAEAIGSVVHRPGRAALTALGTVLGVGSAIAVLGLTSSAVAQVGIRFDAQASNEVVVTDARDPDELGAPPPFPADADDRAGRLHGVVAAGVSWKPRAAQVPVKGAPVGRLTEGLAADVIAASPGLLRAVGAHYAQGRGFDAFHDGRAEQVTVLGGSLAARLGVTDLSVTPAVFVDGVPFTVIGVLDDASRRPDLLIGMLVPRGTAERLWGPPQVGDDAQLLLTTRTGAALQVAQEVALALRPEAPTALSVIPPPDPRSLRRVIDTDLTGLFLVLAGICLLIGAVSIANTTLIAVIERVPEIGLRRAVGARRRHIGTQVLAESAILGAMGGAVGESLGIGAVLAACLVRDWTPVIPPSVLVAGPVVGLIVGGLAGVYPAWRAARVEPAEALRR